jgi:hypothetical protein
MLLDGLLNTDLGSWISKIAQVTLGILRYS